MKTLAIILFCIASLLGSLGLAYALYPYARVSDETLAGSIAPKAMEEFDDVIDLGEDYGPMTIIELMGFYLDNPPQPKADNNQTTTPPKREFGGC